MKFKVGKQYKAPSGDRVMLLEIAGDHLGLWNYDGRVYETWWHCLDEFEEWKEPKQYSGWVNVYGVKHSDGVITGKCIYETKEAAGSGAFSKGRIACIKIDFQEGDGIDDR